MLVDSPNAGHPYLPGESSKLSSLCETTVNYQRLVEYGQSPVSRSLSWFSSHPENSIYNPGFKTLGGTSLEKLLR